METLPGLSWKQIRWGEADTDFRTAFAELAEQLGPEDLPPDEAYCALAYRGSQVQARAACVYEDDYEETIGPTSILGWFAARERRPAVWLLRSLCDSAQGM